MQTISNNIMDVNFYHFIENGLPRLLSSALGGNMQNDVPFMFRNDAAQGFFDRDLLGEVIIEQAVSKAVSRGELGSDYKTEVMADLGKSGDMDLIRGYNMGKDIKFNHILNDMWSRKGLI